MRYSVPRKSRRVPLETEVHLKLEEIADPVTETTRNISLGGMSVVIGRPAAVGSLVAFELHIGDALIEGTGEVVWSREAVEGSERPAGIGIRFRYLSPGSRERIFRLVQWYANQEREVTAAEVAAAAAGGLPSPGARRPGAAEDEASPSPGAAGGEAPDMPGVEEEPPAPAAAVAGEEADDLWPSPAPPLPAARELPGLPLAEPEDTGSAPLEAPAWSWPEPPPPEEVAAAAVEPSELPEAPGEATLHPGEASTRAPADAQVRHLGGSAYNRSARRKESLARWMIALVVIGALATSGILLRRPVSEWLASRGSGRPEATAPSSGPPVAGEAAPAALPPAPEPVSPAAAEAPATPPEEEVEAPAEADLPAPSPETGLEAGSPVPPAGRPRSAATGRQGARREPEAPPLRNVERIAWQRSEAGTVVTIEGDGAVSPRSYSSVRLEGGNPRLLIRLRGVEKPYPQPIIRAGSPELDAIRSGLHLRPGGPELHIVLDLASGAVAAESVEETDNGLRILLRRSGP